MRQSYKSFLRTTNFTKLNLRLMENMSRKEVLERNFNLVRTNIEKAMASPSQARLVAVSKLKPVEDLQIAYNLGQKCFGESYVQELVEKSDKLPKDIVWHFIGSLQTNKCKILAAIPNLATIETLESIKKAEILNRVRQEKELPNLNVFLQINTSHEDNKSGIQVDEQGSSSELEEVAHFLVERCPKLNLKGLMTIGSLEHSNQQEGNPDFELLLKTREFLSSKLGLKDLELSMGMSMDYELAIKCGSTNVRVGSNLFGVRN